MPSGTDPPKTKVAIVGGGCAALTTAFELTNSEALRNRYEVTIYQMGWRLGGKGASGRNAAKANRTEEHGLHVWMGFYENAFRILRACYAELDQDPHERASLFADWQEAFMPDPLVGVADKARGEWRLWNAYFPATPGLPGDLLGSETNPFTLQGYLARTIDLLRALVRSTFTRHESAEAVPNEPELFDVSPRAIVDKVTSVLRGGMFASAGALYEGMSILKVLLGASAGVSESNYKVLQFAEAIAKSVTKQAEELIRLDETVRPKLELIELVVTIIVGMLRDELLSDPQGLDAINDEDCLAWLRRHGASERAVKSSFVRALYNMAFVDPIVFEPPTKEFENLPESERPGLAAGQALRGALRMFFTYRGSLFWKMRAGMGDVVFAPLYEVLKHRGVKFKFFHRLKDVKLSSPGTKGKGYVQPHVTELVFDVQAKLRPPKQRTRKGTLAALALDHEEYYPLDEDGCWPSRADTTQLQKPRAAKKRGSDVDFESPSSEASHQTALKVIEHFDCVVLGISIGAIKDTCAEIIKRDVRWQAMVENVKTTPTQALQVWLDVGFEELTRAPTPTTVSGFEAPFDTWSDMTHVVAQEDWWEGDPPKALAYFCGVANTKVGATPREQRAAELEALDRAVSYFDASLPALWPGAEHPRNGGFKWELIRPPPGARIAGKRKPGYKHALLKTQYFKINAHPSDQYVLSRPGSLHYRISPLDDAYDNLTIVGDWTDCGFNEGCVEAAVMSGRLAAHAICDSPKLEEIVGYDHP